VQLARNNWIKGAYARLNAITARAVFSSVLVGLFLKLPKSYSSTKRLFTTGSKSINKAVKMNFSLYAIPASLVR
jgi:hypothetical protein